MQLLQRWASCHGSFAGAVAAAAMPALLATGLTASPVFRKQPAAVYPVAAFRGGCCNEKKNVLVVSSVGSRRTSSSIRASSSDNTLAAGLVSSINNEQIGKHPAHVTDQLYQYILQHTREPQILQQLREETATLPGSQMQVSPDQAQFLAMLVQIMGAERCIEVGVFHGYLSLAVALVLPEWGRLVACERDERCLDVARKYYERAGVTHKVDVRHGLAMDSLQYLLDNGEGGSYDFAFLDADKRMYHQYYEMLLQLVRCNGLVVVDNILWYGRTANPLVADKRTQSLQDFNQFLLSDERVCISMVPIGDGMTLCRKR
ncbi:hypothetical protein CY35_17G081300 [Sphagnum magellanicum]|nr:hypothetical protein CY35_17G081300 [Sphagnum magellanicum]